MAEQHEKSDQVRHVDVVKNEWLAGFQHVVARVFLDDGEVHVDAEDPDRWQSIVLRTYVDRESGEEIGPDRGEDFLARLHEHMRGDYLFATALHDGPACPYHDRLVVPLQPVQPQPTATAAYH
jgi:hypothetical protein